MGILADAVAPAEGLHLRTAVHYCFAAADPEADILAVKAVDRIDAVASSMAAVGTGCSVAAVASMRTAVEESIETRYEGRVKAYNLVGDACWVMGSLAGNVVAVIVVIVRVVGVQTPHMGEAKRPSLRMMTMVVLGTVLERDREMTDKVGVEAEGHCRDCSILVLPLLLPDHLAKVFRVVNIMWRCDGTN